MIDIYYNFETILMNGFVHYERACTLVLFCLKIFSIIQRDVGTGHCPVIVRISATGHCLVIVRISATAWALFSYRAY